jgi:endonuclease/exonuclease/phosphatase family metal-dependent hydrolase
MTTIFAGRMRCFLLMLAVFASIPGCSATADERTDVRVMCYNIAAGFGDIDAVAQVIRDHNPDIVALQEVDVHWGERSNFEDQVLYLGKELGMYSFFGEIYRIDASDTYTPPRQYGLAWLSKEPLILSLNHKLPRLSTQEAEPGLRTLPGFPEVAVDINGNRIHLYNTHLDYRPDPAVRIAQIAEMMALMQDADTPVILMGDLNARPAAPELQPLFAVLHDAWIHTDDHGYTFPADAPDRRIDYILHSGHFTVGDVYVVDTQASDHRPVVADLILITDGE